MLKAKLECLKCETSGTDIDCIRQNCDECNLCYEQGNMGKQKEALDMAIKALEQEPGEEYKRGWHDAITTALKETHNYYTDDGVFRVIQEESLVGVGMSMQEPKTRWIMNSDYPDKLICEKCKAQFDMWHWESKQMHYCPNCGCKVEG